MTEPRVGAPEGTGIPLHPPTRDPMADLAMLALFGLPQLPAAMSAYEEVAPLADGWQDRLGIHQLFPLLVHACLFGGGYGARAASVAGRYV